MINPVVGAAVVECEEDQWQEESDYERGEVLVPKDVVGVEVEVAHRKVVLGYLQIQGRYTGCHTRNGGKISNS